MMFLSVHLVISTSLVAGIFFPLQVFGETDDGEKLNDHIDELLQNLRKNPFLVSKFDSVKIPSMSLKNLQLSNVNVRGLSSLYRRGDIILSGTENALKITGEMGVRDVSVTANYKQKVLFFWISGEVHAQLDSLALRFKLSVAESKVRLTSLEVIDLGDYKVKKITGFSFLMDWLVKIILNTSSSLVRSKIIEVVEGPASEALSIDLQSMISPFFRI